MAAITYPLGHKSKSTPAPSATEVLAQAQALGVVLVLSDGELRAKGSKAGIELLAQHIRACKPDLVKLLATPPTPAPDPSMNHLLALAMAYCDHIGASDKARKDWHTDIEATPAEQRGELAAYLRSQLPAPKPKAMPTVATAQPAAKPLPKFHIAQPWNEADKAFQAHYWQCSACKVAGRTRGPLCQQGTHLHQIYEQAAMATEGTSK